MVRTGWFVVLSATIILTITSCSKMNDMMRIGGKMYQGMGDTMIKVSEDEEGRLKQQTPSKTETPKEARRQEAPKQETAVAPKETSAPILKVATTKKMANLRPEPSTLKPPIATLQVGTSVEILEDVNGWAKIRCNNRSGWIRKDLLDL